METIADEGRYPLEAFQRAFLTWEDALAAAGIEPTESDSRQTALTEEEWKESFRSVPSVAGERTSFDDVIASEVVDSRKLFDKYNSWTVSLERAGAPGWEPKGYRHRIYPRDVGDLLLEDQLRVEEDLDILGVLYDDFDRVSDEIGSTPRPVDIDLLGQFSAATYARVVGSWNSVREEAAAATPATSLQPDSGQRRAALLTTLERIAVRRESSPAASDIDTWSAYTSTSYIAAFGSIERARDLSGMRVEDPADYATDVLEAELQRIGAEFGYQPPAELVGRLLPFDADVYARAYDSMSNAWREARWSAKEGVPRDTGPSDPESYRTRLLSALADLPSERLDDVTPADIATLTQFSPETYLAFFESWSGVRAAVRSVAPGRSDPAESGNLPDDMDTSLTELAEELGRAPTPHEIHTRTSYTYPEVHEALDRPIESVIDDISAVDEGSAAQHVSEESPRQPTPEDVIEHLWDVAAEAGNPTQVRPAEYEENGTIPVETVSEQFGSVRTALEVAGLQQTGSPKDQRTWYPPLEFDLVDELDRVAKQVDGQPTAHEMNTKGRTGAGTYVQRFGSWEAALELLEGDYESTTETGSTGGRSGRYSDEELLDAVRSLAERTEGVPTTTEMDRSGAVASGTVIGRFGSWKSAVERAEVTETEPATEETDDGGSSSPGRMEMLMELLEMKQELGRPPGKEDVERHSTYAVDEFVEEFGAWEIAVDAVSGSQSG